MFDSFGYDLFWSCVAFILFSSLLISFMLLQAKGKPGKIAPSNIEEDAALVPAVMFSIWGKHVSTYLSYCIMMFIIHHPKYKHHCEVRYDRDPIAIWSRHAPGCG
ncbi:hypothetical protein [Dictyobacter kobayashii]|uniref:Uncharacterized protein n=1 Tax=Dictyobacter kobayashii TaxID=2014872 RepID=A0A402AQI4_9CHLR|nr:hypothetical protein [Dictyobacter kobayashii]GCE21270.1 hypothetical protein KDK_50700 [Dictyobacter kobayashii]